MPRRAMQEADQVRPTPKLLVGPASDHSIRSVAGDQVAPDLLRVEIKQVAQPPEFCPFFVPDDAVSDHDQVSHPHKRAGTRHLKGPRV